MADVIKIPLKPEEFYLPCKCSSVLWLVAMTKDMITRIQCAQCDTVYEFSDDGLEMDGFE